MVLGSPPLLEDQADVEVVAAEAFDTRKLLSDVDEGRVLLAPETGKDFLLALARTVADGPEGDEVRVVVGLRVMEPVTEVEQVPEMEDEDDDELLPEYRPWAADDGEDDQDDDGDDEEVWGNDYEDGEDDEEDEPAYEVVGVADAGAAAVTIARLLRRVGRACSGEVTTHRVLGDDGGVYALVEVSVDLE